VTPAQSSWIAATVVCILQKTKLRPREADSTQRKEGLWTPGDRAKGTGKWEEAEPQFPTAACSGSSLILSS
jgi:hypothetical protein